MKLLLAKKWNEKIDPTGYWISEKLDGVRAYWDGTKLLSRQGNKYHAPDWFLSDFPDHALDGELWIGRGCFQKTVSVVRQHDAGELWHQVRYVVFDAPDVDEPFENRIDFLIENLRGKSKNIDVLDHKVCTGPEQLMFELSRIERLSGEGLMLRKPDTTYVRDRSDTLLKVKSFHDDEAIIIGYKPGNGRNEGRVGALYVKTPNGVKFHIGSGLSDNERDNPPALGSVVTYRYQELTKAGVPRFPTYVGVRID